MKELLKAQHLTQKALLIIATRSTDQNVVHLNLVISHSYLQVGPWRENLGARDLKSSPSKFLSKKKSQTIFTNLN